MDDGADTDPATRGAIRIWNISANPQYHLRCSERIAHLFEGLDLIRPEVVPVTKWRSNEPEISQYCAVGRKP